MIQLARKSQASEITVLQARLHAHTASGDYHHHHHHHPKHTLHPTTRLEALQQSLQHLPARFAAAITSGQRGGRRSLLEHHGPLPGCKPDRSGRWNQRGACILRLGRGLRVWLERAVRARVSAGVRRSSCAAAAASTVAAPTHKHGLSLVDTHAQLRSDRRCGCGTLVSAFARKRKRGELFALHQRLVPGHQGRIWNGQGNVLRKLQHVIGGADLVTLQLLPLSHEIHEHTCALKFLSNQNQASIAGQHTLTRHIVFKHALAHHFGSRVSHLPIHQQWEMCIAAQ